MSVRPRRLLAVRPLGSWRTSFLCLICVAGLALAAGARADSSARITKGPYLHELAATSVEIRAELDTAAPLAVTVAPSGADAAAALTIRDPGAGTMHVVRVDGLDPSTHYSYTVQSGVAMASGAFTTAPAETSTDPFTFLVFGDNRSDDVAHAAVVHQMLQSSSDFIVHTGDYVQLGAVDALWQTFFDIESPLVRDRCVFGCVGNHELVDGAGGNYLRYFGPESDAHGPGDKPKLYGSFRWGSARFFLLDAMEQFDSGPERAWLDDELSRADAENLTWRIVVLHQGPWSAGPHGGNARMLSAGIPALFVRHHIDLLLAGHDHIYERGFYSGLAYVVSGGGGAPLYPIDQPLPSTRKAESVHHFVEANVSPDAIRFVAKRDDGSVLERCALVKVRNEWDCDPPGPSVTPAAPPPPSLRSVSSKCACDVVGTSEPAGRGALAALLVFALAFVRKRRLE